MYMSAAKIMLINEFLARHKDEIDPYEYEFIKRNLTHINGENFMYFPFITREIFDKLGLMPHEANVYSRFADFVNELYDIKDMNILEVGGGVYPTLAERICTKAGKVTVYDPRLSKGEVDTDKLKLVRKDFKKNMSLRDYDLVLALMPCRGAEAVLDACVEQDKDFIVGLCEGGPHGDCFDFYEDEDEWIHSMITYSDTRIRRNGKGKVLTKHLDGCSYPYPIVYNSRK